MGCPCGTYGEEMQTELWRVNCELKRPLGRIKSRWEYTYNIKMDMYEMGWEVMNWINLAADRCKWRVFVNTVMNLWVL
jgi:hypothetical protein